MAFRATQKNLLAATRVALAGSPYYHMPKNVTKTVMRENWKFTGQWLMYSQREQMEYYARNASYGNFALWWQSHFDAIFTVFMIVVTISFWAAAMGAQWIRSFGYIDDNQRALFQILFSLGTRTGSPGAVWFEEEARQKKIGLFFE